MDGPIYVWWIGEGPAEGDLVEHVCLHLRGAWDRPVVAWGGPERPAGTLDPRRNQHASGKLLRWLLEAGPGAGKVLGVTDRDLFIPILTYVFGEAQLGGQTAVVSTHRLDDVEVRFYGRRLLLERVAKEAVHEVGHALGLHHCAEARCVMSRAAGVHDVDDKEAVPCAACRARADEGPEGGRP